tara:strand:- start:3534 stop:4391 length:858 start_codon:yes stop_codon:yes gene_type:complete
MAITDPAEESTLLARYKSLVTDAINNKIVYHDGNLPGAEYAYLVDGPSTGVSTTPDLPGVNEIIDASDIYDTLLADIQKYTRVRAFQISINISTSPTSLGGNDPVPSKNVAAIAEAKTNLQFADEWESAVSTSTTGAFVTKWGIPGSTGSFTYTELVADTTKMDTFKNSAHAGEQKTKAATTFNTISNIVPAIQTSFTANGYGILHHRFGFNIASSDVANPVGIATDNIIDDADIETLMNNLYNAWLATAADTTGSNAVGGPGGFSASVCHNSCHSSCHGSRGRR